MVLVPRARWKTAQGPFSRNADTSANAPQSLANHASDRSARAEDASLIRDFNALIARYEKPVFNVIYQWIGDHDDAADLTQETFISAYKAREQFRGESRLYTWLYRIAHNHCKNRFKQRDRQREIEGASLDAGLPSEADLGDEGGSVTRDVADWSLSPARLLEEKELRATIDRAVEGLASEYKVVLILREVEDLSYGEIAEVTGLTMEAVKTRLNRARAMVRQRVEPYYRP